MQETFYCVENSKNNIYLVYNIVPFYCFIFRSPKNIKKKHFFVSNPPRKKMKEKENYNVKKDEE